MASSSIMTTGEARKILGKISDPMTDKEIDETIANLEQFARFFFKEFHDGNIKIPEKKFEQKIPNV